MHGTINIKKLSVFSLCLTDIGGGSSYGQDQRQQMLLVISLWMLTVIVRNSYEQDHTIEGIFSYSAILWH